MWVRCSPAHRELSKIVSSSRRDGDRLVPSAVRATPGDTRPVDRRIRRLGVKMGHEFAIALKATNDGRTGRDVCGRARSRVTLMGVDAGRCARHRVWCARGTRSPRWTFRSRSARPDVEGSAEVTAPPRPMPRRGPHEQRHTFTMEVGPASSTCDLWGTAGNDRIVGGPGGEVICGLAGADRLYGRGGSDVLLGGAGNDLLVGGKGRSRDELQRGGDGRDRLPGWSAGGDRCRSDRGEVRKSCS